MTVAKDKAAAQTARVLASNGFQNAGRARALLEFLVSETLDGRGDQLKEYTIGVGALGRGEEFDPRTDPIVRAEASRLRTRLENYYAGEGKADPIEIVLPRGTYVLQFQARGEPTEAPQPRRRLPWHVIGGGIAILSLAAVVWLAGRRVPRMDQAAVFLDIELKTGGTVASEVGPDFAISPDGARLVFVSLADNGVSTLHVKRFDRIAVIALPETEGARVPFFSPDGNSVAYWAAGKLKKVSIEGGAPVVLCDATDLLGGTWTNDGAIIAAIERQKLSRVPAAGGRPEVVLDLSKEMRTPAWPQYLPRSKQVVFTSLGFEGANRADIEAITLMGGDRKTLVKGGTYGRVVHDSQLIYTNQGTLFRVPLDGGSSQEPVPTAIRVPYSGTFGHAQFDVSRSGTLVYRRTNGLVAPAWLTGGTHPPAFMKGGNFVWPALSPDAKRLAVAVTESGLSSVWVQEQPESHLTKLPAPSAFPLWTPDGEYLVLGGRPSLGWIRLSDPGQIQLLTESKAIQNPWSFSPDGKVLAYHEYDPARGFDLWTVPVTHAAKGLVSGRPTPFLQTPAFETYPAFSPDGRWMAYASNESGTWQVYVRAFPGGDGKVQVSEGGGRISRWSRQRREIVYRTDDHRLMVAAYSTPGGEFKVDSVRPFGGPRLAHTGVLSNFDLAADGRVLGLLPDTSGGEQSPNHVTLVLNFWK